MPSLLPRRPWYPALALGILLHSPAAIALENPPAYPAQPDSPQMAKAKALSPYEISPPSPHLPHLPISPPPMQEDLSRPRGLPLPTHPPSLHSPAPTLLSLVRYRRHAARRPRWGAPRWSYGGAARGDGCRELVRSPVVPVVPLDSSDDPPAFLAATAAPFPSLLVYVPETTAQAVSLVVVNENRESDQPGEVVYERTLPIAQSPGILRFDFADAVTPVPLAPGMYYTWMVSLVCHANDPSGNPFVQGLIQRVMAEPSGGEATGEAIDLAQLETLGQAGLWHETVAGLADLYCDNPNDREIQTNWQALLGDLLLTNAPELVRQVQSQTIADAPLLWCGDPTP